MRFSLVRFVGADRLAVYTGVSALALVINALLGKDMASDTLSYHIYAGFSALHDRFGQDYFPAGPQSYFNPYVYAPFYAMIRTGASSLEISTVIAVAHSVMLWLTYELALSVCPYDSRRRRLAFGLCAVAFAFVNPVLIQQIGSPFADILTGELILAGWLLLALAIHAPSTFRVLSAGALCGVAAGLKLTNAVHAISGFALLLWLPTLRQKLRAVLAYGTALGVGFLVVMTPWSYRLERRFGNPIFPLMNSIFRSPEYTTEPARAMRFIPATLVEGIWRPFAMVDPVTMVHEELRVPDVRYAVLILLLLALIAIRLRLSPARLGVPAPVQTSLQIPDAVARTLAALGGGIAIDWITWLTGSGNSRYFLPMSSVAAVVIVALFFRLLAARPKTRNYFIASILAIQGIQLWMGADYRWNETRWDQHWINIAVPAKLASEPNLYLTMGAQTNSFVAPYLAPGSGLINFSGLYTLGSNGASGAHVRALINRYSPHTRMLIRGERLYSYDERRTPNQLQIDDALSPFDLRVDESDCQTITVHGLPPPLDFALSSSKPETDAARDTTYLLSCRVFPDTTDHTARIAERRDTDLVLDHLEDACPDLFQPRRPNTEYSGEGGLRRYGGTDLVAWVSHGTVKFLQSSVGGDVINVGSASDWRKAPMDIRCGRRNGRYLVGLAESAKAE